MWWLIGLIAFAAILWWSWWTLPLEEGRVAWEREQRCKRCQ